MEPEWNGFEWRCAIAIASWDGVVTTGTGGPIEVVFLPDDVDAPPPTPEQRVALHRLLADDGAIREAVVAAMRAHYERVRPEYVEFAEQSPDFMGDPGTAMPDQPDAETFAKLHELQVVYVHRTVVDGLAHLGLGFRASWEPEHGLGVMVHGPRVVDVGGADTAFLEWVAEKDAERAVSEAERACPPAASAVCLSPREG